MKKKNNPTLPQQNKKQIKIPGFIDIQINGYGGLKFSEKNIKQIELAESFRQIIKRGTCVFLPTVVTSSMMIDCINFLI